MAAEGKRRKRGRNVKSWVKEQCEGYRDHIRSRALATPEEVAAVWPPAKANTEDWIRCYGSLRVWIDTQDTQAGRRDQAEEVMLAALRDEPEQVALGGGQRHVKVYPKGLHALLWFRSQDWLLGWLSDRLEMLREAEERGELDHNVIAEPVTFMRTVEEAMGHELAAMAAVACHEGPGLGPDDLRDNPGEEWTTLDPVELYAINRAFFQVNAGRMEALQRIVKPPKQADGSTPRMSWNVFLGSLAMRMETDTASLAKHHSLVKLMAQVGLANSAEAGQLR